jgi:hypothetical protein
MGYKDKYKNMGRSNLTFLNADGGQSNHEAILAQIQKELDAELAKISYTDPQGQAKRDAVFADAERKIKAENRRYDLEKLFGRVGNVFTTTQAGLTTLGITPPPRDGGAPVKGQDNYQPPANEKDNTLLIVGGVVLALGIVGFVIYKARK